MKLQILLAMMLLTVVVFAADSDNTADVVVNNAPVVTTASDGVTTSDTTSSDGTVTVTNTDADTVTVAVETTDTVAANDTTPEPNSEVTTTPVEISEPTESKYGSCTIDRTVEGDNVAVSAKCVLTLPTPCHAINYGWIPGSADGEYIFSVWVKQKPGVCTQTIYETTVEGKTIIRNRNDLKLESKIHYSATSFVMKKPEPTEEKEEDRSCDVDKGRIKKDLSSLERSLLRFRKAGNLQDAKDVELKIRRLKTKLSDLHCVREVVAKELPASAVCVKERLELEGKLKRLYLSLRDARESGDQEAVSDFEHSLAEVKKAIEELPAVSDCAKSVREEKERPEISEKLVELKNIGVALRAFNPCRNADYVSEKITNLEAEISSVSEDEANAIREKISVLSRVRENLLQACDAIKSNKACATTARFGDEVTTAIENLQAGDLKISDLTRENLRVARQFKRTSEACFKDIKRSMEKHPCMASEILGVAVERLSASGDATEVLDEMYEKTQDYKEACLNKNSGDVEDDIREKLNENKDHKEKLKGVTQAIGELELKKFVILSDDSLSESEKMQKVAELEQKKISFIRETLTKLKRARVSSAMKLKFAPNRLELEGQEVQEDNVTVEVPTDEGDSVDVTVESDETRVSGRNAKLRAKLELTFENGKMKFKGKALLLPDKLAERLKVNEADFELEEDDDGNAVYRGQAKRKLKLFAIIPVNADVSIRANAENGTILDENAPWWAMFAVG